MAVTRSLRVVVIKIGCVQVLAVARLAAKRLVVPRMAAIRLAVTGYQVGRYRDRVGPATLSAVMSYGWPLHD